MCVPQALPSACIYRAAVARVLVLTDLKEGLRVSVPNSRPFVSLSLWAGALNSCRGGFSSCTGGGVAVEATDPRPPRSEG